MNTLSPAGENEWRLPQHAHVIVHEKEAGKQLLTIYDCGAAQKPPTAQLLGQLVNVDAEHELLEQPHGYIVKLRERALLLDQGERHWVIRGTGDT